MRSIGVGASKVTTASVAARAARMRARSRSPTMGRPGPLRRVTEASLLIADDDLVTESAAVFEQCDMADVQDVEAAVGEDDGVSGGAPFRGPHQEAIQIENLLACLGAGKLGQRGEQLVAGDGDGSELADDDSRSDVSQPRCVFDSNAAGCGQARVAITVSPAPETSKTCWAIAGA